MRVTRRIKELVSSRNIDNRFTWIPQNLVVYICCDKVELVVFSILAWYLKSAF